LSDAEAGAEVRVYLELGSRRTFACACEWPGWARSGRSEEEALAALGAYTPRYRTVATGAGLVFPEPVSFQVVERLRGSSTTDFGAPGQIPSCDRVTLGAQDGTRLAALLGSAWQRLDEAVAAAPSRLRKGPRGGGRDRDAIVAHVLGAESVYARRLGLGPSPKSPDPVAAVTVRDWILAQLTLAVAPAEDTRWPLRYAARRMAWHVLDHAWEMEDRSLAPSPEWYAGQT